MENMFVLHNELAMMPGLYNLRYLFFANEEVCSFSILKNQHIMFRHDMMN